MSGDNAGEPRRFIRPKDLDNAERTTFAARLAWRIEALAWDCVYWYPMKALPLTWASNTAAAILKTLGPLSSQHRTMVRNLRMCFPDWSEKDVQRVAKKYFTSGSRVVMHVRPKNGGSRP